MNPGPGLIQGAHLHLDIHSNYLSLLMEWEIEFEKILPIYLGMNQKVFINGKYFSNTFFYHIQCLKLLHLSDKETQNKLQLRFLQH